MGWGSNQYARISKETSWGVTSPAIDAGTATEGTDFIWIRLPQADACTVRPSPVLYDVRSADGGNRKVQQGSARTVVGGSLMTLGYPTQIGFWLDAAITLIGSGSPALFDLQSYTLDFFDTEKLWRFVGGKVDKLSGTVDNGNPKLALAADWTFKQDTTPSGNFNPPDQSHYPAENPYTLRDQTGVKINGSTRVKFSSLGFTIDNVLAATPDEGTYISALYYAGRDVSWSLRSQYAATADRTAYQGQTAQITNQIGFAASGHSLTLDLKSSNFFSRVDDNLPIDHAAYQQLALNVLLDRTALTDISYSTT